MCRMVIGFTDKPTMMMHTFFNKWEKRQSDGFGYYCMTSTGKEYMRKSPFNEAFKMHRGIKTFMLHCRLKTNGVEKGNGGGVENHPFLSEDEALLLAHNGCLSGYKGLRKYLIKRYHHQFASKVDSEVLLHLFEQAHIKHGMSVDAIKAWLKALNKFNVTGNANVLCLNRDTMEWFAFSEGAIVILKPLASKDLFIASDDAPLGEDSFFKFKLKSGYCIIGRKNKILSIEHIGNIATHSGIYGYHGVGGFNNREINRAGLTTTYGGYY